MTLAELRTATRDLVKESQTDAGTLLPSGDVLLDRLIDWGCEQVQLDLVEFMPEIFLATENISLTASTGTTAIVGEYLQIWCLLKNVSSENPWPLNYVDMDDSLMAEYVGEETAEPEDWTLVGDTIHWFPTPSADYTNYAVLWGVVSEGHDVPTAGPTYIPAMAHKLIPIQACILLAAINESAATVFYEKLYARMLKKSG